MLDVDLPQGLGRQHVYVLADQLLAVIAKQQLWDGSKRNQMSHKRYLSPLL